MVARGICKKQCVSGATLQVILVVGAPNSFLHLQFGGASFDLPICCFVWIHIVDIHLEISFARSKMVRGRKSVSVSSVVGMSFVHTEPTQIVTVGIDL